MRYLATMIHNVNVTKRQNMLKPQNLFTLPQDNIKRIIKPKSTKEQFLQFKKVCEDAGIEF
tara:strand:+ start:180 stop:362 length:183 start_codon:yes stop_codon:yes gene_type:complete